MPPGSANMARVAVTLPPTEFLDNTHIRGICTRPQFSADECPTGSVYGEAKAWSPLLEDPLHRTGVHALLEPPAAGSGRRPQRAVRVAVSGRIDAGPRPASAP